MDKQNRMLKIIIQFIVGSIVACGVFLILVGLIIFFDSEGVLEDWHLVLFIIMPVGSLSGIFLIDKLLFKAQGYNVRGMTIGFLLGFVSIAFLQWFVPVYRGVDMFAVCSFIEDSTIIGDVLNADGIRYVVFFPLTITLFSVIGYNLAFYLSYHVLRRSKVLREAE